MMRSRPFDIAILGSSLTARLTAALLAKQGKKVILLQSTAPGDPWWHSSSFLDKLLGALGGRACYASYQPFQVFAAQARVTIQPEIPLDEELAREFGATTGAEVLTALAALERLGEQVELLLGEFGSLPASSLLEQLRWRWLAQRRKVPVGIFTTPLHSRLAGHAAAAQEWLTNLFQGLALQPLAQLSVADGALLWAQARRPEGLQSVELDSLLDKRCEQFHVVTAPLDSLSSIALHGQQWQGTLADSGQFRAIQLLLGDRRQITPAIAGLPLPPRCLDAPGRLTTSPLQGKLSSLLEHRVIAGGPLPLRLVVTPTAEGQVAQLGVGGQTDEDAIREHLQPVLPFARYQLAAAQALDIAPSTPRPIHLGKLPIQTGQQLWCADAAWLLPQLGNSGAALLTWALLQRLAPGMLARD